MITLETAVDIAQKIKLCYEQRRDLFDFDPATDVYVKILRGAMAKHKTEAIGTALSLIELAKNNPDPEIDISFVVHGFLGAAYYLLEIEPKAKN